MNSTHHMRLRARMRGIGGRDDTLRMCAEETMWHLFRAIFISRSHSSHSSHSSKQQPQQQLQGSQEELADAPCSTTLAQESELATYAATGSLLELRFNAYATYAGCAAQPSPLSQSHCAICCVAPSSERPCLRNKRVV